MGHSYGRITAPVSTDDVAAVLGKNSHDVKTLCMSDSMGMTDSINKWAKYKPIVFDQPGTLTLEQRKQRNFGLANPQEYNSKAELMAAVKKLINGIEDGKFNPYWVYNKVGPDDWGRLDDFLSEEPDAVGYNHYATIPFGGMRASSHELLTGNSTELIIGMIEPRVTGKSADGELSMSDFTWSDRNYADWYLGVFLYKSDSKYLMATMNTPIGTTGASWQVNFGHIPTSDKGTYLGIPVLCSKPFTQGQSDPQNVRIIGLENPGVEVVLQTMADKYHISVRMQYSNSTGTVAEYTVSITNTTNTSRNFSNVSLRVAKDNTGSSAKTAVQFGNFAVAAGETWSRSGTYNTGSRDFNFGGLETSGMDIVWSMFKESLNPVLPSEVQQ